MKTSCFCTKSDPPQFKPFTSKNTPKIRYEDVCIFAVEATNLRLSTNTDISPAVCPYLGKPMFTNSVMKLW